MHLLADFYIYTVLLSIDIKKFKVGVSNRFEEVLGKKQRKTETLEITYYAIHRDSYSQQIQGKIHQPFKFSYKVIWRAVFQKVSVFLSKSHLLWSKSVELQE